MGSPGRGGGRETAPTLVRPSSAWSVGPATSVRRVDRSPSRSAMPVGPAPDPAWMTMAQMPRSSGRRAAERTRLVGDPQQAVVHLGSVRRSGHIGPTFRSVAPFVGVPRSARSQRDVAAGGRHLGRPSGQVGAGLLASATSCRDGSSSGVAAAVGTRVSTVVDPPSRETTTATTATTAATQAAARMPWRTRLLRRRGAGLARIGFAIERGGIACLGHRVGVGRVPRRSCTEPRRIRRQDGRRPRQPYVRAGR